MGSNYAILFNAQQIIRGECKVVSAEIRFVLIKRVLGRVCA